MVFNESILLLYNIVLIVLNELWYKIVILRRKKNQIWMGNPLVRTESNRLSIGWVGFQKKFMKIESNKND